MVIGKIGGLVWFLSVVLCSILSMLSRKYKESGHARDIEDVGRWLLNVDAQSRLLEILNRRKIKIFVGPRSFLSFTCSNLYFPSILVECDI